VKENEEWEIQKASMPLSDSTLKAPGGSESYGRSPSSSRMLRVCISSILRVSPTWISPPR
jgi:hypothetical protein